MGSMTKAEYRKNNPVCERCGSEEDLSAHHIIPQKWGLLEDPDIEENYVTLCRKCHWKIHTLYDEQLIPYITELKDSFVYGNLEPSKEALRNRYLRIVKKH